MRAGGVVAKLMRHCKLCPGRGVSQMDVRLNGDKINKLMTASTAAPHGGDVMSACQTVSICLGCDWWLKFTWEVVVWRRGTFPVAL